MEDQLGGSNPAASSQGAIKTLLRGAALFFFGLLFGKIAVYLFRLIVSRLGAANYGIFSLALSVFNIAILFAVMGAQFGAARFIPEERVKRNQAAINNIISSAIKITLVSSIAVAILLALGSEWIAVNLFRNEMLAQVLFIVAIALPFSALGSLFSTISRAFEKVQYEIISKYFIENIVNLGLTAILIYLGWSLFGVAVAFVIASVCSFLALLYLVESRVHKLIKPALEAGGIERKLLSFSFPLIGAQIVFLVMAWGDVIFLGIFRTVAEVGDYSTALPTATLLALFPTAFGTLFLPIIIGVLTLKNAAEFKKIYSTLGKWIFLVNFSIFLLFVFYGRQVLRMLFGPQYEVAAMPLAILAFGYLGHSCLYNGTDVLNALNKQKKIFRNTAISAATNIILNILLVPAYGTVGAAVSISCALVLLGVLNTYEVYRLTSALPLSSSFIKIIIAGLGSLAATTWLFRALAFSSSGLNLLSLAIVYAIMYFALLLLMRVPDRTDFDILLAIEKKAHLNLGFIKNIIKRYYNF
ncbi:MAG: flippase [Candidatus Micrarchaeota archaeon]